MELILTGLVAGFVHVLAGPDHLAAVAPLAVRHRFRSWILGLRWGIGHTGGVLIVGVGALLLRGILPIESMSAISERLVGVFLIGLGLWMLRKAFDKRIHLHGHDHQGQHHSHFHLHSDVASHSLPASHKHTHTALAVGTLHGLAGSSHVLGILPALAIPSTILAAGYMVSFGIGTILGMVCFSSIIGWLSNHLAATNVAVYRGLTITSALAAIIVGGFWLSQ